MVARILATLFLIVLPASAQQSEALRQAMESQATAVRYRHQNEIAQQHNAIAFLLGWDSELILAEEFPGGRQEYLLNIKRYLHELGLELKLKHPAEYYFHSPVEDDGARGQAFADEVMAILSKSNPEAGNHFGASHNLLLDLTDRKITEATRRARLESSIEVLDIPTELKRLPADDLVGWADKVHNYFISSAGQQITRSDTTQPEALPDDQTSVFDDPGLKRIFDSCKAVADALPSKCQGEFTQFTTRSSGVVCHWGCGQTNNPHQLQHGPWKFIDGQIENEKDASH